MQGRIVNLKSRILRAWAWNPDQPDVPVRVMLTVDGTDIRPAVAQAQISPDPKADFPGGPYGLRQQLPLSLFPAKGEVVREVSLYAVDHDDNRTKLHDRRVTFPSRPTLVEAEIDKFWRGHCHGWARHPWDSQHIVEVRLLRGNRVIVSAAANLPTTRAKTKKGEPCGFNLSFPPELWRDLDPGERLEVRTSAGDFIGSLKIPADDAVWALLHAARDAERAGDGDSAIACLERVLHWQPHCVDALWARARLASNAKDNETARAFCERVRAIDPSYGPAINLLARIAHVEGRSEDAIHLWAQLPPTASAYREGLLRRSQILKDLGRPWQAIPLVHQLLATKADDLDAHLLVGRIYLEFNQTALARRHLARAAQLKPDDRKIAEQLNATARPSTPPPSWAPELFEGGALRAWTAAAAGHIAAPGIGLPAVFLRPAAAAGTVDYRIGAPSTFQAGGPPSYGVILTPRGSAAELGFRFRADPRPAPGQRLYMEVCAAAAADVEVWLALGSGRDAAPERRLASVSAGPRAGIVTFDFIPAPAEAAALAAGKAWLVLRLAEGHTATLHAPWPLTPLAGTQPEAAPGPEGISQAALALLRRSSPAASARDRVTAEQGRAW